METVRSKRGGWAIVLCVTIILALLVTLYVLSSAQGALMLATGDMDANTFNTIYAPLLWVTDRSETLTGALDSYWSWYVAIRRPPQLER